MEASALTPKPASVRLPGASARRAGVAASIGLILASVLVAAGAAAYPTRLVPSARFMFPEWLSGPFTGLGAEMHIVAFGIAFAAMLALYVVALRHARAIPARWVIGTAVGLHVIFLLAPPLLSTDIFGYLAHARLWSVHDLNPYTNIVADIPGDPVNQYLGRTWPKALPAPYGPLLLVGSPVLVGLGFAGGMWALKIVAAGAALASVALVWTTAKRLGHDPRPAAALVGFNPVWLAWAVGGAHNDLPMVVLFVAALALAAAARPAAAGAVLSAAVAVKATAGLVLVALLCGGRSRGRVLVGAAVSAVALLALSFAVFGIDLLNAVPTLLEQGQGSSRQSVPRDISRLLGSEYPLPVIRHLGTAIFGVSLVALLVWSARTRRPIDAAGWLTVALLATTTWLHAWYIVGLLPLAALAESRRLKVVAVVMTALMGLIQLTP